MNGGGRWVILGAAQLGQLVEAEFKIELGAKSREELLRMIEQASSPNQIYLLSTFVRICIDNNALLIKLRGKIGKVTDQNIEFSVSLE